MRLLMASDAIFNFMTFRSTEFSNLQIYKLRRFSNFQIYKFSN